MIIEVTCKSCGEITKIKATKLENKIKALEKELRELRAVIKFKEQNNSNVNYSSIFNDLFNDIKTK